MNKAIRNELLELSEEGYKIFSSRLIPNVDNILGVRLPLLRQIAKRVAKDDWRSYLEKAEDVYFEETMLQGMVIGYLDEKIDLRLDYVSRFVPKINNWSVCDSFCAGLKVKEEEKETVWQFLQPYLKSNEAYSIRFSVVMLLNYYTDESYTKQVFKTFNTIKHDDYYVKMAVAWAISIFYTKLPKVTLPYLKNNKLDDFTHNKALQKIGESLRIDSDTRDFIQTLKRKKEKQ